MIRKNLITNWTMRYRYIKFMFYLLRFFFFFYSVCHSSFQVNVGYDTDALDKKRKHWFYQFDEALYTFLKFNFQRRLASQRKTTLKK